MTRDFKVLTTFWFIIGLIILLLNDFVFKGLYSNWLTGKLSDFSGLFIFPLFCTAFIPRYKNKVFWLTALFFIYWKSGYSQPLIDGWNSLGFLKIIRTIDYTDLIALTVLPISYNFEKRKYNESFIKFSPIIPIMFSAFAFIATSSGAPQPEANYFETYQIEETQQTITKRLNEAGQEKCFDSNNKNLPPYKYCRIFIKNDSIEFIDIEVSETKNGQTSVLLNTINYNKSIFKEKDGDNLDSTKKQILKKIFEREVLNKMIKNSP